MAVLLGVWLWGGVGGGVGLPASFLFLGCFLQWFLEKAECFFLAFWLLHSVAPVRVRERESLRVEVGVVSFVVEVGLIGNVSVI